MNKHIELVKKWLNDPDSVTLEELRVNRDSAQAAAYAAAYAADEYSYGATYWVKRYEELSE